jgi:hypothetical protein
LVSSVEDSYNESGAAFNIYPNPATGSTLHLQFNDEKLLEENIFIVDVLGRIININSSKLDNDILTLDTSQLETGVYFITLATDFGRTIKKISVLHY